jgi:predicted nuclease of predicted toxin-antitoxin system
MKLLFDQNISFRIIKTISVVFPSASHVKILGLEGKSDFDIWEFAKINGYTIVTFAVDFFEISIVRKHPPKVIWLRFGNSSTEFIRMKLIHLNQQIEEFHDNQELSCLEVF